MDQAVVWLRFFHLLEVFQVALYKGQAASQWSEIDRRMFLRTARLEQQHADKIRAALHIRHQRPGSVAPFARLAGLAAGGVLGLAFPLALRLNIWLENKAIEDYQAFITECDDPELKSTLWANMLDESLHAEWFKARLEKDVDKLVSRVDG